MAAMAAAPAKDAMTFFPHDAHAADDDKCRRLIRRLGWDGYGRWWRVCEVLASSKNQRIAFSTDEDVLVLADMTGFSNTPDENLSIERCRGFIADLADIGLLTIHEDGSIGNDRMDKNARYQSSKRSAGAKGGASKRRSGGDS